MELFNVFELKILVITSSFPLFQRISSSSSDTCRALFGRLPRPAKRSCFALSSNTSLDELNSRSRTMDRVQPLFFKCLSSDAIIKGFLVHNLHLFCIVYFGVEMLEQSVKLSRLIIFYFISNFPIYAPILPKREPKTSALGIVFVFRAVFQLLYSWKENVLQTPTIAVFARNWGPFLESPDN